MAFSLAGPVEIELEIRKSRFIGRVESVADRGAAVNIVQGLRDAHPGATHVCWALLAGGDSAAVDDGEPSGTAGRPMLDVLRHHELEFVLATVVRYFGGVKLGAGGLTRAYSQTVAQALRAAVKVERVPAIERVCLLPYALEGRLRHLLEQRGIPIVSIEHDRDVRCQVILPAADAEALEASFTDSLHGQIRWESP